VGSAWSQCERFPSQQPVVTRDVPPAELAHGVPQREQTKWRDAIVLGGASIQDAIRSLDRSGLQIVLVTSPSQLLIGTVTDGDIRRGLLRGCDTGSSVDAIMNRDPIVVPPLLGRDTTLQLMQANKIRHLPIVDGTRQIVGLHTWEGLHLPSQRSNLMVVMAGGKGTRLMPHTENCPKPMLQIGGKPMLEHIIERAKTSGITRFAIAVNYLGHMIEEFFGDGTRWSVQIDYLREELALGTAGALGLLQPVPEHPFLVTNGDVLTDIRYDELLDFHFRHAAMATMAVRLHEWQHPFGVVRTKGVDIIGIDEKPVARSHINAGIYVLQGAALDVLTIGEPCDMPELFARLREREARTIVYPMHEPWLDVGRDTDLARARTQMSDAD
jgi:dTDP-glucose pyrophosphorylase